jgi:hypothetical protein
MPEVSQTTHEDHHRALVSRLASEVKPARRLRSVGVRLVLWMLLEVGVLAWVVTHTDNDFLHKLKQPVYTIEIIFFTGAAIISAILALRSTIPGRTLRAGEVILGATLVLAGTALLTLAKPIRTSDQLGEFLHIGLGCTRETVALAATPWLLLWWLVSRGFPTRGTLSGLLVGAGAMFFSFAMMRIACPIDEPLHLLTWHLLPAFALIALSTWAGAAWLRFRRRIPRTEPPV